MSRYPAAMMPRTTSLLLSAFIVLCGLAVLAVVALSLRDL